ncbi:MAG: hypothetical protein OXG74_16255 [Acidobacteria bacterium]|nr:hypothetical protein [Acidobacteriota bacterium]
MNDERSATEPAAAALASVHAAGDDDGILELFEARGWTDGLPIVPPTPERVAAALDAAVMEPGQVLGVETVRGRAITAQKAAINAVMAGCRPRDFAVVAAAVEAMCDPAFLLHGATSSTGGCAVMIIVNGPIRQELGMTGTFNALGGADRASLAIGRAVRLILRNLLGVRPGELDRSTLGHPGKLSYCLAEDEEGSPWPSLGSDRGAPGGASTVTVFAAGSPRQLMNEWTTEPEAILDTVAAEMRANMLHYSIWAGNHCLVLPPQLRERFADVKWTKADIRAYLHRQARVRRGDWERVGKAAVVSEANRNREYRALQSPEDLVIVAAGGPAGGFAAVIPPWFGNKSRAVTAGVGFCLEC